MHTRQITELIPKADTEGFAVIIYDAPRSGWQDAVQVVADSSYVTSEVRVTSSDGLTSVLVPRQEFISTAHDEPELTISADWGLEGVMDGYVLGAFRRTSKSAVENYQYGALDRLEAIFIGILFARFKELIQVHDRAMLAVDARGLSSDQDWLGVYDGTGSVPESASLMVIPPSGFKCDSGHLTRRTNVDGMVLMSPGR